MSARSAFSFSTSMTTELNRDDFKMDLGPIIGITE